MSELKSLRSIWNDNDRKPIKVVSTETGEIFTLVGVDGMNAYVHAEHIDSIEAHPAFMVEWKLQPKRKKKVKLYQALVPFYKSTEEYYLTGELFSTLEAAREHERDAIRLATELPAIEIEVDDD